jgi:GR25 family glycosyltransferase involved in LPS biosynthesis
MDKIYMFNNLNVYWINLDRSPDRRDDMKQLFTKHNIKNFRVSAYDGKIMDSYTDVDFKTDRSPYEMGCTLSHLKAIKSSYENNDKIGIIMEDDLRLDFIDKWEKSLHEIINAAPHDWEIIKLHCVYAKHINKLIKRSRKMEFSPWETRSTSTGCYIINKKGMKNMIDKYWKNDKWTIRHDLPVADNILYVSVKTYDYTKPTFTHEVNNSTIHNEYLDSHREALVSIQNYYRNI